MNESAHEFPKEIGNPATSALVAAIIPTLELVSNKSF